MATVDTIARKFYRPLQLADRLGTIIFWVISILSTLVLIIDKKKFPELADAAQIILIIMVLLFFVQGQFQRLYLFPRAEDKRRKDLLSNSFNIPLTHDQTVGYYNNDQTNPIKRLAASVMESAFFTREILGMMLPWQRAKTISYIAIFIAAILSRSTDLEILALAAQALFGGEVVAQWLRMEWLRVRSDRVFENINRLFGNNLPFNRPAAQSEAIDLFSYYETTKSTAATLLSSNIFHKHNADLTQEWNRIRNRLGI